MLAGNRYVKARIASDRINIQPSGDEQISTATLAIVLEVSPGWHIYWENSGDSGSPPEVKWSLPEGWRAGDLIWPAPKRIIERGDIVTYGYNSNVTLASRLYIPAIIPEKTETVDIAARVRWLVCAEICVPGEAEISQSFEYGSDLPLGPSDDITRIERTLAEAPRTAEQAASTFKPLNGLLVDAAAVPNPAPRNSQFELELTLSGLAAHNSNLARHLQFFPHTQAYFDFGAPRLRTNADGTATVISNVRVISGAPQQHYDLSGILLIGPKISGATHPISVQWTGGIEVHGDGAGSGEQSAESPELPSLSYRTYHAAETLELAAAQSEASASVVFSWSSFLIAVLAGFFAGMILNLMPCVLPIISIKVMGFINMGGVEPREAKRTVYAFSAGILFSFLALAAAIITLRNLGTHVGWGFQFQHPAVVFLMFIVVFVLSLIFFDVYTFKIPYLNSANKAVTKMQPSLLSHFFEGILVTALSTPCTAPFLGTALAFAFIQPAIYTVAIFLSIGLGLALPYTFLATHPALLKRLPKPGPWEYRLKEFLGFLLLGTGIWLLFVLNSLTSDGTVWAVASAVFIFFCLWLTKNLGEFISTGGAQFASKLIIAGLFVAVMSFLWPKATQRASERREVIHSEQIAWKTYSEELIRNSLDDGRVVFIDFTADWCVTCKANEQLVIETDAVGAFIKAHEIVPIKADWTSGDEKITEALYSYGAQGVPLYVVISPKNQVEPNVLPTLLTQSILLDALSGAI
ncbi:MAG: thioredoxin family protein [Bdellovibrionales bacterium]|nr:thioredoxin family protein [Bdellovibrionales bacterium]